MVNSVSYVALNLNFYIPNKIWIDVDDIHFFSFTQTQEKCVKMIGDSISIHVFLQENHFLPEPQFLNIMLEIRLRFSLNFS